MPCVRGRAKARATSTTTAASSSYDDKHWIPTVCISEDALRVRTLILVSRQNLDQTLVPQFIQEPFAVRAREALDVVAEVEIESTI